MKNILSITFNKSEDGKSIIKFNLPEDCDNKDFDFLLDTLEEINQPEVFNIFLLESLSKQIDNKEKDYKKLEEILDVMTDMRSNINEHLPIVRPTEVI